MPCHTGRILTVVFPHSILLKCTSPPSCVQRQSQHAGAPHSPPAFHLPVPSHLLSLRKASFSHVTSHLMLPSHLRAATARKRRSLWSTRWPTSPRRVCDTRGTSLPTVPTRKNMLYLPARYVIQHPSLTASPPFATTLLLVGTPYTGRRSMMN
jgi:hypothetical protein